MAVVLDLFKVTEKGAKLTVEEHDANFTNIETSVNQAIDELDDKAPTSHTHVIADVSGLQEQLDEKVNIANLPGPECAAQIGIEDTADNFDGTNVEVALAELAVEKVNISTLASPAGAGSVGIVDTAGNFTATTVEAALAELADTIETGVDPHTHPISDVIGLQPALDAKVAITDLASVTGAGGVGILDTAALITATTVEGALAETMTKVNTKPSSADVTTAVNVLRTDLATSGAAKGAHLVNIQDVAGTITATTVEGALAEHTTAIAAKPSSADITTGVNVLRTDLATVGASKGAHLVAIQDVAAIITATTVETALAEIAGKVNTLQTDMSGVLKQSGNWSAATGAFPSGALKGNRYWVSVAGIVNTVSFSVGDTIEAKVNSASTTNAGDWFIERHVASALADVAYSGLHSDLSGVPQTRTTTLTDGTVSGTVQLAPVLGEPIANGALVFNIAGQLVPVTPAQLTGILFPDGVTAQINSELGSDVWQGGGLSPTPSQFGPSDWAFTDLATNGNLRIAITTLPSNGGSALTAVKYELNSSGTLINVPGWTAPSGTGNYTISGLTNGVSYSCRLYATNANGNGPASASKSATPTNPAYVPHYVNNGGDCGLQADYNQIGADSTFFTLAVTGRMLSDTAGTLPSIFKNGSGRVELLYNYNASNMWFEFILTNTAGTIIGKFRHKHPLNQDFTLVYSGTTGVSPAIDIYLNGTALVNTGDPATGYSAPTALVAGTIDWFRSSGLVTYIAATSANMYIAEFLLDTQRRLSPTLFHDGQHQNWSTITGTQINLGHGMTAAQWNSPASNNLGSAALTKVGTTSFTDV